MNPAMLLTLGSLITGGANIIPSLPADAATTSVETQAKPASIVTTPTMTPEQIEEAQETPTDTSGVSEDGFFTNNQRAEMDQGWCDMEARKMIADQTIKNEKAIQKKTGVVNARALHDAADVSLRMENQMARAKLEYKKFTKHNFKAECDRE